MTRRLLVIAMLIPLLSSLSSAKAPAGGYFNQGMELYRSGRNSEAVDAFEEAIKHKDNAREATSYIDRIRKETVERIRNRALTGVSKANWQSKYFYMNQVDGRVRVGISVQEVFERDSVNLRTGAVDALKEIGVILAKAKSTPFDIDLINEVSLETTPDPTTTTQQLTTVFSYISLAARSNAPKF